ncbi:Uncharacterised protein [Kingella kingae]|nr:Uncharacterised protein [Kingella kingae]
MSLGKNVNYVYVTQEIAITQSLVVYQKRSGIGIAKIQKQPALFIKQKVQADFCCFLLI